MAFPEDAGTTVSALRFAVVIVLGLAIILFVGRSARVSNPQQALAAMHVNGACPSNLAPYGNPLGADTLSNLRIGLDVVALSYRFHSTRSDSVQSVRVYIKSGEGYSGGNGGTLRLDLVTDDPKGDIPTNQVLASAIATYLPRGKFNRLFEFKHPPLVSAGAYYHLVFSNSAPDPRVDFISINNLLAAKGGQSQLAEPSVLTKKQTGSPWLLRADHFPIFALEYSNGDLLGQGYIDALSESAVFLIKGTNRAREKVSISGGDIHVTEAHVRVRNPAPSPSDISASVEDDTGTVLNVTRAEIGVGADYDWVRFPFGVPLTLRSGKTYNLVLSSVAGVDTFPLQGGDRYGFGVPTLLTTGGYELNTGSAWTAPRSELHLQYYFCR